MTILRPVLSPVFYTIQTSGDPGDGDYPPPEDVVPLPALSGLLPETVASFSDTSGWSTNTAMNFAGGKAVVDGAQTSSFNVIHDIGVPATDGDEYACYLDVRERVAGTVKTRFQGPSSWQSKSAGVAVSHVLRRRQANAAYDSFGFTVGSTFEGEIHRAQAYHIQPLLDGPLDIYILAGQSNMAGSSAVTGMDASIDVPEFRALGVSIGESTVFGAETDGTGPAINANLNGDYGIGHAIPMVEPVSHASANSSGVSPATAIATRICDGAGEVGRTPVFVCAARGGTDLRIEWNPAGDSRYHDLLVANVNALIARNPANAVKGMFWCQGESSAAAGYAADFKAWCDGLRVSYGAFPVVLMEIGGSQAAGSVSAMIFEQQKLATGSGDVSAMTDCAYVARPSDAALEADGTHFTATTNRKRGLDAANAMINLL